MEKSKFAFANDLRLFSTKFHNLSSFPRLILFKWISFDRSRLQHPPIYARDDSRRGKGNRVGQTFSLYLTSETTLYFVRNEPVVARLPFREHLVPLVNASRIVPNLNSTCAQLYLLARNKILQNFSQTFLNDPLSFTAIPLNYASLEFIIIVSRLISFFLSSSIYDGNYERLCPGIYVDTFRCRIFIKRNIVANYRGEKVYSWLKTVDV